MAVVETRNFLMRNSLRSGKKLSTSALEYRGGVKSDIFCLEVKLKLNSLKLQNFLYFSTSAPERMGGVKSDTSILCTFVTVTFYPTPSLWDAHAK